MSDSNDRPPRILIVEDEMILEMDLEQILQDHGFEVVGVSPSVERAVQAVTTLRPDAATLDLNLRGQSSAPVADALHGLGIPFVVASGYTEFIGDFDFQDAPFVRKPVATEELIAKLRQVLT